MQTLSHNLWLFLAGQRLGTPGWKLLARTGFQFSEDCPPQISRAFS